MCRVLVSRPLLKWVDQPLPSTSWVCVLELVGIRRAVVQGYLAHKKPPLLGLYPVPHLEPAVHLPPALTVISNPGKDGV